MKKIIFIITATAMMTACNNAEKNTKQENSHDIEEEGHAHDADGNHIEEENVEQEEFVVEDSSATNTIESAEHQHEHGHSHEH